MSWQMPLTHWLGRGRKTKLGIAWKPNASPPPFLFGTGLLGCAAGGCIDPPPCPVADIPGSKLSNLERQTIHTFPVRLGWQPITGANGPCCFPDFPFASIARWRSRRRANGIVDPQPPPPPTSSYPTSWSGMKRYPPCPRIGSGYKTCLWPAQESKLFINNHQQHLIPPPQPTTFQHLSTPPPPLPPNPPPPPSCVSPPSSPPLPPWLPYVPPPPLLPHQHHTNNPP